jgi:hypothetical protein
MLVNYCTIFCCKPLLSRLQVDSQSISPRPRTNFRPGPHFFSEPRYNRGDLGVFRLTDRGRDILCTHPGPSGPCLFS